MLTTTLMTITDHARNRIIDAYRMDENDCVNYLLSQLQLTQIDCAAIAKIAHELVIETRENKKHQPRIDALLHQYDLSTEEGIALMCLAEALLRIPDKATMDKLISDKLSSVKWQETVSRDQGLFMNAAAWSLVLTGKIYHPLSNPDQTWLANLKRAVGRLGMVMTRPVILQMMKTIGKQFVMGQTIETALKRAKPIQAMGYRFSYDMLGESARTQSDADRYFEAYVNAIHAAGNTAQDQNPAKNPGISVKLSALHPRFEFSQRDRVMRELPPKLLALAQLAKQYHLGLTIDAEEADRLDLTLDVFEKVFTDSSLNGWAGFGIVVQAYQKRASFVIDWLIELSNKMRKQIMLRLVKGAYWDAEIKTSQILGLLDYPVFTRKNSTDVSYLACAQKMLAHPENFYAQFGTHNAYSVAAILAMAGDRTDFEFQCLHGMGRTLYDQIVDEKHYHRAVRIYAPVGTHKDLLGYLVRRLLENGANSSFINRLANDKIAIDKIIEDPVARIASLPDKRHPKIPKPRDIYRYWQNSTGVDLTHLHELQALKTQMDAAQKVAIKAGSIVNGKIMISNQAEPIYSPANHDDIVGHTVFATAEEASLATHTALAAFNRWSMQPVEARAEILEHAADLFQESLPEFATLLSREGGKCIPDCISEIREAIDYCRYYAYRARKDFEPQLLPGPTGEENYLGLHPRGVFVCISPWNFPLAIFTGQLLAALVTGNTVIAKPAEQTPLIAFKTVQLLYKAGIPKDVLQLILGAGDIGAKLVADNAIAGVMFTGSTETAKTIEKTLANREGAMAVLIAETGGQNAMIVDSSALLEQAVIDITHSAFNSAGQRCSALRVLFVQTEIADALITMLAGYMKELQIGNPSLLSTDIPPVIDEDAMHMLQTHANLMQEKAVLRAEITMSSPINGHYFMPRAFELSDLSTLKKEVFGPILHIIRYNANELDQVIDTILATGYGLTLGIHSRISNTVEHIIKRSRVGNIYVNRNMIGAVVGVQPFGGEGLSGTGSKAGGPHYLPRLCVERTISINTTAVGGNARLVSLLEED